MREIRFRIWDGKKKEWLGASDQNELTWYGFGLVGECMSVQAPPQWAMDEGMVVEEFTGVRDSSSREIYEGDIVKVNSNNPIRQVCYVSSEAGFGLVEMHKNGYSCVPFFRCKRPIEVIGNIHENPELLGEEDK